MTSFKKGSGVASKAIDDLAKTLSATLPSTVYLLVGITLTDPKTGQKIVVDLIAVAECAVIVGVDSHRKDESRTTLRTATRLIRQLQQETAGSLPVYAHWLAGDALGASADEDSDAAVIEQAIIEARQDQTHTNAEAGFMLIELLLHEDANSQGTQIKAAESQETTTISTLAKGGELQETTAISTQPKTDRKASNAPALPSPLLTQPSRRRPSSRGSRGVSKLPGQVYNGLKEGLVGIIFPDHARPIRPPQITKKLKNAMLAPENSLEDVHHRKIVPNLYVVELNQHNYKRYYQPIESELREQWQKKLKEHLSTTNSRLRRNEYVCLGAIKVQLKPVNDLPENQANIICEIVKRDEAVGASQIGQLSQALPSACLELKTNGRQWPLHDGIVTIGRDEECNIYMDMPIVQEKCLISGQHAYIRYTNNSFHLFDGSRQRRPSTNGTFVNCQRILQDGHRLQDGDTIILAALDPNNPLPDTPGVVELLFCLASA